MLEAPGGPQTDVWKVLFQQDREAEGQTPAEEMDKTKKRGGGVDGGSSLVKPPPLSCHMS